MGPLVFPKDRVVNSIGPDDQQDGCRKRLWSGLNLLVVGPPGSGKMSLISVLGRALEPGIRLTLFDLEAEPEVQTLTLDHFAAQFRPQRTRAQRSDGLILRHLHRLSDRDAIESAPPVLYATCHEQTNWDKDLRADLETVFPCQVHLAGMSALRKDLSRFVLDVLAELNQRHGKRITEVESTVLDALHRRMDWRSGLHELRNMVERAYFREDTERLSARSIEAT
jgi:hypothetical protein